ncbi:bifunctional DNA primase/polymerase [Bradyrhizobium sp. WSM471]|uniref:bifunctional DNA primase/polymerase n=1 Tax=Bradyrhizobium sp. WSM471 TaxID=319017 RepID=UPI00024D1A4E|nr:MULTISPECIES: bifunctional DNA primase/polymerase [Bradyrhizobium]EHQ99494.1 bifunctional DNA primase/polymerase famiily protein [Bradyrhizobium sp. WSM471]UFW41658.1 bifunctional DNA primase/polymerase [Bradyrhizobium canariense]
MSNLLAAALDYAARGLRVFPCTPRGKTPAVARGFRAATTNPATIRRYWTDPERNIAVPTGASSGFWVLDIDGEKGAATLRALVKKHGALPDTRTVLTARGAHAWFAYPGPIPTTVGRVGAGIDTRGDDGYVIVPPSVHETGHRYVFLGDPWARIAAAPAWLINAVRTKPGLRITERAMATNQGPCRVGAYGHAALQAETAALAATLPGRRNDALNRAAFNLFRLVAGGELAEDEVIAELHQACITNGLVADDGRRNVHATILSGRAAGLRCPRSRGGP